MNTHRKSRRFRNSLIVVLFLGIGIATFLLMPVRHTYHVSPETTYITSPLDTDGYVDYVTGLNERLRGDITPEQNANVLIWQTCGPNPRRGGNMPPEYFEWLGFPEPPEEGEYFIHWYQFLESLEDKERPSERDDLELKRRLPYWARRCPWKTENEPELAEWICSNKAQLELFTQASKRTRFYNPIVLSHSENSYAKCFNGMLMSYRLDNVSVCYEVAEMIVCRAMMNLGEDRADEAWEDLMTCHRIGALIEQGGTLSELLDGTLIRMIAERGELVFLSEAKLTPARIAICLKDLNQLAPRSTSAEKTNIAQRFMILDLIQQIGRKDMSILQEIIKWDSEAPELQTSQLLDRSIDLNQSMRIVNNWFDRNVAVLKIDDDQSRLDEFAEIEANLEALHKKINQQAWTLPLLGSKRRGELLGQITICSMMRLPGNLILDEVEKTQRHLNLTVAFALAGYRAEYRIYPQSLDELTPKYLRQIPNDILANAKLTYLPKENGYKLRSIGTDELDKTDRRHGKFPACLGRKPFKNDLVIEMPVKTPQRPKIEIEKLD